MALAGVGWHWVVLTDVVLAFMLVGSSFLMRLAVFAHAMLAPYSMHRCASIHCNTVIATEFQQTPPPFPQPSFRKYWDISMHMLEDVPQLLITFAYTFESSGYFFKQFKTSTIRIALAVVCHQPMPTDNNECQPPSAINWHARRVVLAMQEHKTHQAQIHT